MVSQINQAIALDLGTTSIKAGWVNEDIELETFYTLAAPTITVDKGRYESDALAYIEIAEQLLLKCLSRANKNPTLGIAFQRSSFLLWQKANGKPVTPLISWQDNRGTSSCAALRAEELEIQRHTGLRLTPYYFAPKLDALLQEQPELRPLIEQGKLLVGTLDSFLLWHWSSGKYYQTDVSMGARTLLIDNRSQQWSNELCSLFNIPSNTLPKILPSNGQNQSIVHGCILQASLADQSAALIASVTHNPEDVLVNLGTGGFVIRYLPVHKKIESKNYLRTTVYQDHLGTCYHAVEGTLNAITSALTPYPFTDCHIDDLAELSDVYCLAEPPGIGAPYFRTDLGLVFSTPIDQLTEKQIAGLILESIVFRVALILEDFHQQYEVNRVILSGGLSALQSLQQGIAQCSQANIHRLLQKESTLLGAGMLALGVPTDSYRKTEPIQLTNQNHALSKKYQSWKIWFDKILCA